LPNLSVDLTNPLRQSMLGKYFIGQTEVLSPSNSTNAWAQLFNPSDSGVNLHVNVFTLINISGQSLSIQQWLDSTPPGSPGTISTLVSPANRAISPLPSPQCSIQYVPSLPTGSGGPTGGVHIFNRTVAGRESVISEEQGKLILPPGGNFLIFLTAASGGVTGRVAFGWWEEPIS